MTTYVTVAAKVELLLTTAYPVHWLLSKWSFLEVMQFNQSIKCLFRTYKQQVLVTIKPNQKQKINKHKSLKAYLHEQKNKCWWFPVGKGVRRTKCLFILASRSSLWVAVGRDIWVLSHLCVGVWALIWVVDGCRSFLTEWTTILPVCICCWVFVFFFSGLARVFCFWMSFALLGRRDGSRGCSCHNAKQHSHRIHVSWIW